MKHNNAAHSVISSKEINIEVHISKQMKYFGSKTNYFKVHKLYLGIFVYFNVTVHELVLFT